MMRARQGEIDIVLAGTVRIATRDAGSIDQNAFRTVRRGQRDYQVADPGVREVEHDFDMFDIDATADRDGVGNRAIVDECEARRTRPADQRLIRRRTLHRPGFGQTHRGQRIDQPEAEIMAGVQAAAIPIVRAVVFPARVGHVGLTRRIGEDFLDVAIAEQRVRFENQRHRAGGDRRRRRRAAETECIIAAGVPVRAELVGRRDTPSPAVARRADKNRRARRAVGRYGVLVRDRRNGKRLARILEAVIIDVLAIPTVVAGGPQHDGSQAAATVRRCVLDRQADTVEIDAIEIVEEEPVIAPTVVGDVQLRRMPVVYIGVFGFRRRTGEDPEGGNRRIERDTDCTAAVVLGRDKAGDGRAVRIRRRRKRIGIIVAIVELAREVVVVVQIVMGVLDTVIDDADADTRTRIVVPNLRDVDIETGYAAELPGIEQMPLFVVEQIVQWREGQRQGGIGIAAAIGLPCRARARVGFGRFRGRDVRVEGTRLAVPVELPPLPTFRAGVACILPDESARTGVVAIFPARKNSLRLRRVRRCFAGTRLLFH